MKKHLAIFTGTAAEDILQGRKTIESRFSKAKIAPFLAVNTGDIVYIKPSGKELIGEFRVKKVIFIDGLKKEDFMMIKERFGEKIFADERYWQGKNDCKYGTLIFIGESARFLIPPLKISKRDLRGWVILD